MLSVKNGLSATSSSGGAQPAASHRAAAAAATKRLFMIGTPVGGAGESGPAGLPQVAILSRPALLPAVGLGAAHFALGLGDPALTVVDVGQHVVTEGGLVRFRFEGEAAEG